MKARRTVTSHCHAIASPQKLQIVQIRARGEAAVIIRLGYIFIALGRRRSVYIIENAHCSINRAESVGAEANLHVSRPTAVEADTKSGRRGRDLGPGPSLPTCVQRPPAPVCHKNISLLSHRAVHYIMIFC